MPYDEKSIRILNVAEQREMFSFAAAEALHKDYPHVPVEFIHRMLNACQASGWPRESGVARYLDGNKAIRPTPEFEACYRELMSEARQ